MGYVKARGYTPDPVSCPSSCFSGLPCRSSPANLVLHRSGLGWSCAGSLCQGTRVGPGYLLYLGGLGEGVDSFLTLCQEPFQC